MFFKALSITSEIVGIIGFIISLNKRAYRILALFCVLIIFGVAMMFYSRDKSELVDTPTNNTRGNSTENIDSIQTTISTATVNTKNAVQTSSVKSNTTALGSETTSNSTVSTTIEESKETTEKNEPINFLEIKVNGVKNTYYMREQYGRLFNKDQWNFLFYLSKYDDYNSFIITLPEGIISGDSTKLIPDKPDPNGYLSISHDRFGFFYTPQNGNQLFITNMNDGSEINIKVDKWGGSGGLVEGHLDGVFNINQVDKITFENGYFKARIQ